MLSRLLDNCLFLVYWCFTGTLVLGWVLCCLPSFCAGSSIVSCVILMWHIHCLMHFVDGIHFFELFVFGNLSVSERGKKPSAVELARCRWFIPTCCLAELIYFKLQRCLVVLGGLWMLGKVVETTFYCNSGKYQQKMENPYNIPVIKPVH